MHINRSSGPQVWRKAMDPKINSFQRQWTCIKNESKDWSKVLPAKFWPTTRFRFLCRQMYVWGHTTYMILNPGRLKWRTGVAQEIFNLFWTLSVWSFLQWKMLFHSLNWPSMNFYFYFFWWTCMVAHVPPVNNTSQSDLYHCFYAV